MIELLQRWFLGHNHKWVRGEKIAVHERGQSIPEGQLIVLQCEVCGKMRNHKIHW